MKGWFLFLKIKNQFVVKEEHISQASSYNYLPSFDDYDEAIVEVYENQEVFFLANINHPFHEINKPTYDDYQMEFEKDIAEICQEKKSIEITIINESDLQIPPISFSDS